jgi:putative RNA 2'-phosphotransferase
MKGNMGKKRSPKDLAKFLSYVLGRRPDELGLVTDSDGFVKIKDLLKAVNEEEGWRYVRRGHIDEVLISVSDAIFEIKEDSIRVKNQDLLVKQTPAQNIPKTLFTCVTRKSYPNVLEKGVFPGSFPMVILSSDKKMTEKIGKRRDPEPVMLFINTQKTIDQGVLFIQAGETLFTAKTIPLDCFTGPPLLKPKTEIIKPRQKDDQKEKKMAGSFVMEPDDQNEKQKRRARKKRKNEVGWKEDRKKMRKGSSWSA